MYAAQCMALCKVVELCRRLAQAHASNFASAVSYLLPPMLAAHCCCDT
jgi:hypothetical protein